MQWFSGFLLLLSGIAGLAGFILFIPVFFLVRSFRSGKSPAWFVAIAFCLALASHGVLEVSLEDAVSSGELGLMGTSRVLSPGSWALRRDGLWDSAFRSYPVSLPAVTFLLTHGASPDEALRAWAATMATHGTQAAELLSLILSFQPDPDIPYAGRSPLAYAIDNGRFDLGLLLLQAGARPRDPQILHRAAAHRAPAPFLRDLAEHLGPDSWKKEDNQGRKPLHLFSTPEQLALFASPPELLLEPDRNGATLLHLSVQNGNLAVFDRLREMGFPPDTPDAAGCPPLAYARDLQTFLALRPLTTPGRPLSAPVLQRLWANALQRVSEEFVRLLLQEGCDPNAPLENENRPLHEAAERMGGESLIPLLIAAGAQVNLDNPARETPLHTAIRAGNATAAAILLDAGADPRLRNGEMRLPIDFARETLFRVKNLPRNLSLNGIREEFEACRPWEQLIARLEKAGPMAEAETPGEAPAIPLTTGGAAGPGSGEIASKASPSVPEERLCPSCGGTGKCPECSKGREVAKTTRKKKKSCRACRGSEICSGCAGQGRLR